MERAYKVENGAGDDGIEGGCAGEIEQAVDAAEADREDGRADGEIARRADDREEGRERYTVLHGTLSISNLGVMRTRSTVFNLHHARMPRSCVPPSPIGWSMRLVNVSPESECGVVHVTVVYDDDPTRQKCCQAHAACDLVEDFCAR